MIISASYRTDIPAFYSAWFLERLKAGWVRVVNPYGGRPALYSLASEDVDGFLFWTKNIGPFQKGLADVHRLAFPFVVHMTITGYPRLLESRVIQRETAIAQAKRLRDLYGPKAVVWRYDPILHTTLTPFSWHVENFSFICQGLQGITDEVSLSWATIYHKTRRNLDIASKARDFTWYDPEAAEKRALLQQLSTIALAHDIKPTLCSQPDHLVPNLQESRCIDAHRLSDIAGRLISAKRKGTRPGCGCYESRDIGEYDSCPHGCVYCYAVRKRAIAKRRYQAHDFATPYLCHHPTPEESAQAPSKPQKSSQQMTLPF